MAIHTTYTSDIRQVEANNKKLEQHNTKLIEQNKRLRQSSGKASRAANEQLAGLRSFAMQLGGTFLSVQGAIQGVTAAIKDADEMRKRARAATLGVADRQAGLINMLGDVTSQEAQALLDKIDKTAEKIKPKGGRGAFYETMETAVSVAGDVERALPAAELGTRLGRKNQEEAVSISGGILDIAQITGETKDLMKNAGMLVAATTVAHVTSMEGMARYGARAAGAIQTTGGTPAESLALFSAITKAIGDSEGRVSKTTAISLADALKKFLPEKDVFETDKRGRKRLVTKGTGLTSPRERMEALWADPKLAEAFDAKFVDVMEKGGKGGVRKILGWDVDARKYGLGSESLAGQAYKEALVGIPEAPQAGGFAERKLEALEGVFTQQVAGGERAAEVRREGYQVATQRGKGRAVEAAFSAGELSKELAAAGVSMYRRWTAGLEYRTGTHGVGVSPEKMYTKIVQDIVEEMRTGEARSGFTGAYADRDTETAKALEQGLFELVEETRRQTAAIEARNTRPAPAAAQAQLAVGGE